MPKTLITSTGPNFIEKEDSPSDGLGFFSQVQHYEKQLGINGITGNTVFTLTKPYVVGSDTLMDFVKGQKAEKAVSPANELQYEETDLLRVTFGASLANDDVVEFSVLGTYEILDTTQLFMPPGFVFPVVNSNSAPAGTLPCEGGYVSKTTYSALFSGYPLSLGTYYGDGGSTFRLPDYRGRFLRGRANGSGRDPDRNSRISSPAGSPAAIKRPHFSQQMPQAGLKPDRKIPMYYGALNIKGAANDNRFIPNQLRRSNWNLSKK
jgi:hypothetical protein